MNILFLYISLSHLSQNGVFVDLIKEFDKQGHNVKVVTPSRNGDSVGLSKEAGIYVVRFKAGQLTNNKSNIQKGIAYIKLIYQFTRAVKKHFASEKFDLIIAHSLPPEIGIITNKLKRIYKAKLYLMLCEYVWQDSVSLDFFSEKSLICRYYKYLEKKMVHVADFIGSPSQGNIDFTLKYYPCAKNKNIRILHHTKAPLSIESAGIDFKAKYGIQDKFVAIYGGNMSIAQKIENVIKLAHECLDYKDICFLMLGRGQDVEWCKKAAEQKKLTNIVFVDFLPQEEYYKLLSVCDVGIISLNEKLATPNIPSKTLDFFNLALPVLASIDRTTDYGYYLDTAEAGLWSYAGDTDVFKKNLLRLYLSPDLRKKMGQNGLKFYKNNLMPIHGYNTIIKQVNS